MADKFDTMMGKFLNPISDLKGRIKDSLYFLRQDGCFVFSHGYYHPTPGYFIGKIIYYPQAEGDADIWGRRYQAMHKAWINGEHVAIMNDVQIVKQYEVDPTLDPDKPRPLVADYTLEFPLDDFVGYFDPARSLTLCREIYPETVKTWATQAAELMDFPLDRLGVTGSLAYGKIEETDMDFDVIFMGDLEQNLRVRNKLHRFSGELDRRVFEFGRYWPIRIYHNGFLLCPFFVYRNWDDVPLAEAEISVIERDVRVTGTIADDTHNAYLPIIFQLKDVVLDGKEREDLRVICYDGSIRGEYWEDDRIWLEGRLLKITDRRGEYDAVAVDISFNISKKKPNQYPI